MSGVGVRCMADARGRGGGEGVSKARVGRGLARRRQTGKQDIARMREDANANQGSRRRESDMLPPIFPSVLVFKQCTP